MLACNNFEVIDLGVMVPCEKILDTAREKKVDIIGLSGLITPSLDEMVHNAREMERQGFKIPLLIGGATTSRIHTSVKIAPNYSGPTIHVLDASRSVTVVNSLLAEDSRDEFIKQIQSEYEQLREEHERRTRVKSYISLQEARANRVKIDWEETKIPEPKKPGITLFKDYPLEEIRKYIDWTPFFHAWEMQGKFPQILEDEKFGSEAKKLFDDANQLLDKIITEKWLVAHGVVGLFPANSAGDDIEIYADEHRERTIAVFHTLRQQTRKTGNHPNQALADFVAPKESGKRDYLGAFAVTAGLGIDEVVKRFEQQHDDYHAILVKALADRLAEAFAELLHEKVRKEIWGYAPDENLSNEELIKERYQGIRPAPGYPACPDHTEKRTLFFFFNV